METGRDVRFLKDMLRHAFYWRSGGTIEEASLWRYVSGWGRRGDTSVVALEDGFPIGAAWSRLFTRDEPGFGFVDEQTPRSRSRSSRAGGGGHRLRAARRTDRARGTGRGGLSLSVADDSPAMHVFEKQGFERVEQNRRLVDDAAQSPTG